MSLPTLKHVANIHLDLAPGLPCGTTPKGTTTWFEITSGTITSAPSCEPHLHLEVLRGSGGDYATVHQEAGVVSLDVHFLARRGSDIFRFRNTGFIRFGDNPAVAAIMSGKGDKSTEFGEAGVLETITCQTAAEEGAGGWMNWATMVAQGRLLVDGGGGFVGIEFRVFEVKA